MKENDNTPKLKIEDVHEGDVLLFTPNPMPEGLVGQAIVLLTGGTVSHSAIFLGEIDGENKVAHAIPGGITIASFNDLLQSEPCCYVRRHKQKTDFKPVINAAKGYAGGGNAYPFANLGILGLLMLVNRFSEKILKNRIFYDFALLVGLKIMKALQDHIHPDTSPMTCSQFASQCYTDAGPNYDIKFNKLFIQFGKLKSQEDEMSLFELAELPTLNNLTIENQEAILKNEYTIAENFLNLLQNKDSLPESAHSVQKEELAEIGQLLLLGLRHNVVDNTNFLADDIANQFSTNRNYYVTPDDLYVNSTNLDDIGCIDKEVL